MKKQSFKNGFTIVELLVVIVVIGVLAAITAVSYSGISNKAISSSLQSDLVSASKQLKMYQAEYGVFPNLNQCPVLSAQNICLKSSPGNTFNYQPNSSDYKSFSLTNTNMNNVSYRITNESAPALYVAISCPSNFIVVPGSATYGTNDFCVMKYAASQVGVTTTPISQSNSLPWRNISQTEAIAYSPNVAGCTGCHLVTEAEWLTIAQNALSVSSNWSTGVVGSGYIFSGHNDNNPASVISITDTNDGYSDTGNVYPSNQRRTLNLTNGEIIWDFSGNVLEWTSGQTTGGQPGITGESVFSYKDWTAVTALGTLSPNPFPIATGLAGSNTWNSAQGIGRLHSHSGDVSLRGFYRGSNYNSGSIVGGVLGLWLSYTPSGTYVGLGFRVAK